MSFNDLDPFDDRAILMPDHLDDLAALPLVATRDDFDEIAFFEFGCDFFFR
jgi:hypothetical protein